ncbi:hypothetical protein NPM20_25615, partial [Vibrio parahaemolyticus]|nr:hypothetical protein [Vibrio parahaemolyticus]
MKYQTFSIFALSLISNADYYETQLSQQPNPELFVPSDSVEVNCEAYRKVQTNTVINLSEAVKLQAGD